VKGPLNDHLAQHGWARFDPSLDSHFLDELSRNLGVEAGRGGRRDLLAQPVIQHLIQLPVIARVIDDLLGSSWRCIRGLYFDKNPEANWFVPWHRDLVIAVQERHDMPGYGPWSVKDSVVHVQPSQHILENMLAIRLHLDDCGSDNGPLRVISGSHLTMEDVTEPVVELTAKRGEVLVMRPLLLHLSGRATAPNHRRVIHLEYVAVDLPSPLQYRWNISHLA
jgi:hypothetical protein